MKIAKKWENTVYTLLLIIGAVAAYQIQHECVKVGFDAAMSASTHLEGWIEARK